MQYTIIRVYVVPGDTQQQAQDRFREAVELGVERDFHVRDYCRRRAPEQQPSGKRPHYLGARSWLVLIQQQLFGR